MRLHHTTKYRIMVFATEHKESITEAESDFLLQLLCLLPDSIPKFRMSLKAHKSPWKMRPIVSCCGTALQDLSRWLDHYLKKLKPFIPSYVRAAQNC